MHACTCKYIVVHVHDIVLYVCTHIRFWILTNCGCTIAQIVIIHKTHEECEETIYILLKRQNVCASS